MGLTDEQQQRRRDAMREIMVATPYIKGLGIVIEEWSAEGVTMRLPFNEALTNDGRAYHGGVVASLADSVGAASVWAGHDFDKGVKASTVSLTLNYLGAADRSDLLARASCVKRGRDLSFSEIRVTDAAGKPVASAVLTYRIVA